MKTKIVLLSIFFLAGVAHAAEPLENAGFGNIWYSKDPFYAGERITIHTVLFNSGEYELSGTVEFYDDEVLLGRAAVAVPPGGKFVEASVPWKVTEGHHKIFAVIKNAKVGTGAVALENEKTGESEKFVAAAAATSTVQGYIEEKLVEAKEYTGKLPAPVRESLRSLEGALEKVRVVGKTWANDEKEKASEKIAELKAAPRPIDTSFFEDYSLERPFAYVTLFGAGLLGSMFGNKLFFYGGLFIVLIYVIRFVKRVFFF